MKNGILNYLSEKSKYWWSSLIAGIVAIVLSICCIATPDRALIAITYAFVTGLIITGIFDIIFAVSNREIMPGWGWSLMGGIIDILFGILLITLPLPLVTAFMVFLVGFWILFRSIWAIGVSAELNNYINAGWLLAFGIFSLLFATAYLFSPAIGGVTIIALASVAFLFYGIYRIYYAFELKKINKKINELKK